MMNQESIHFENNPVDFAFVDIPEIENLSFIKIEDKYWKVILIRIVLFILFLIGVATIYSVVNSSDFRTYSYLIIATIFLISAIAIILSRISFLKKAYQIRDYDVVLRNGILSTTITILPINRIQQVKIHESILMRFFKLAIIQVYSSTGQANGQVRIPGIKVESAHKIRAYLTSKINDRKELE